MTSGAPIALRQHSQKFIDAHGLNKPSAVSTDIVQALNPICLIETPHGQMCCRAGHGRLVWRAETFLTEEPQTIRWLDAIQPGDLLWDIGANVGLYSIYAARFRKARVIAFEPESQNFALLCDNLQMNQVWDLVRPTSIACAAKTGLDLFYVQQISKGIAWSRYGETPPKDYTMKQMTAGYAIDDLAAPLNQWVPTHIKIDVDGTERDVIAGALEFLCEGGPTKSMLIELDPTSEGGRWIMNTLQGRGRFRIASSERNASTKPGNNSINYVFERAS